MGARTRPTVTLDIAAAYPDLKRNVSGSNLDWLVEDNRSSERGAGEPPGTGDSVNLAKLLCGSEWTLAVVTEAEVSLEPVPGTKSMGLLACEDLLDAVADVEAVLEHDPAAVELIDDVLLDLARDTEEFIDVVSMIPKRTRPVLLVEFYADDDGEKRAKVVELLADRVPGGESATGATVRAFDALEAVQRNRARPLLEAPEVGAAHPAVSDD